MSLKKIKVINIIFMFILSFLWHYGYDLVPNNLTAVFFPVNESIWEHMKIIYSVFLVGGILEYILAKRNKIKINNILVEVVLKSVLGIIFYLVIYIPLYLLFGDSMIIAIGLMLITYIVMELLGYKIITQNDYNIKILPIILLILGYVLFLLLTFYPRYNFLFFDNLNYGYGIIK